MTCPRDPLEKLTGDPFHDSMVRSDRRDNGLCGECGRPNHRRKPLDPWYIIGLLAVVAIVFVASVV